MAIYSQQSLGKQEVNRSREKEGFNQILQALTTKRFKELKMGTKTIILSAARQDDLRSKAQGPNFNSSQPLKATRPLSQLSYTPWICRIYLKKQTGATESN